MGLLDDLRLQIGWGADEALAELPIDRLARPPVPPPAPAPAPAPVPAPVPGAVREAPPPIRPNTPAAALAATELAARASTPAELRAALERFEGCDLRHSATSLVFADGTPTAGLVLIGEAPGAEEDRGGRAFTGPGGQLLDRMLASIGLDRTQCLLTYVIPWRPPGNRPANEAELGACLPFLFRHLVLLRPRRIVALGAVATRVLTGSRQSIGRVRGHWTESRIPGLAAPVPTLPMLHPDQLRERPLQKREAWSDLLLLRRSLDELRTKE